MSTASLGGVKAEAGAPEKSLEPDPKPEASEPPVIGGVGTGRKVSTADIQLVQNLIERCLQMYMSQREVVSTLQEQARVEPGFTQLVWQKLEEQNPDFFRAYYTRLKLKDQIVLFNHLLEQQVGMFQKMSQRTWGAGASYLPGQPSTDLPGLTEDLLRPPEAVGEVLGTSSAPFQGPATQEPAQPRDAVPSRLSSPPQIDDVAAPVSMPFGDSTRPPRPLQSQEQRVDSGTGLMHMAGLAFSTLPDGSPLHPGFRERSSSTADLTRLPRNFSLSDLAMGPFDHAPMRDGPHMPRIASGSQIGMAEEAPT